MQAHQNGALKSNSSLFYEKAKLLLFFRAKKHEKRQQKEQKCPDKLKKLAISRRVSLLL
jgi:hypothetical protein